MKALETTVTMLAEKVDEQDRELKKLRKLYAAAMKSQGRLEAEVGDMSEKLGGGGGTGGRVYVGKRPPHKVSAQACHYLPVYLM